MPHPNAISYTAAMGSLASGDVDSYLSFLAEEVQWWELGSNEPVIGRTAVAELLSRSTRIEWDIQVHDVLANDEHLVALIHAHVTTHTDEFDASHAEVLHFSDAGRVTKRQIFPANIWSSLKILDLSDQWKQR